LHDRSSRPAFLYDDDSSVLVVSRASKSNGKFRDRPGHTLFIDARKFGHLVDRKHRELSEEEIARIARAYHAWRGEKEAGKYEDARGFCKSVATEAIIGHGFILTPGRYVGATDEEEDDEPFPEKMNRLATTLQLQRTEAQTLDVAVEASLKRLGYGT
jgi:type I restriction enzyme M protein